MHVGSSCFDFKEPGALHFAIPLPPLPRLVLHTPNPKSSLKSHLCYLRVLMSSATPIITYQHEKWSKSSRIVVERIVIRFYQDDRLSARFRKASILSLRKGELASPTLIPN